MIEHIDVKTMLDTFDHHIQFVFAKTRRYIDHGHFIIAPSFVFIESNARWKHFFYKTSTLCDFGTVGYRWLK